MRLFVPRCAHCSVTLSFLCCRRTFSSVLTGCRAVELNNDLVAFNAQLHTEPPPQQIRMPTHSIQHCRQLTFCIDTPACTYALWLLIAFSTQSTHTLISRIHSTCPPRTPAAPPVPTQSAPPVNRNPAVTASTTTMQLLYSSYVKTNHGSTSKCNGQSMEQCMYTWCCSCGIVTQWLSHEILQSPSAHVHTFGLQCCYHSFT